jgi:hypothetical protein
MMFFRVDFIEEEAKECPKSPKKRKNDGRPDGST